MPIGRRFIPKDQKELNQKVLANPKDPRIPEYIQTHLEKSGDASYVFSVDSAKDVPLKATRCIVFLIGGRFKVGEDEVTERGVGHLVENEEKIQLQTYTIVVIIDQD